MKLGQKSIFTRIFTEIGVEKHIFRYVFVNIGEGGRFSHILLELGWIGIFHIYKNPREVLFPYIFIAIKRENHFYAFSLKLGRGSFSTPVTMTEFRRLCGILVF